MFLLPTYLGRLADAADRRDSTRFALNNVQLSVDGAAGRFTAAATDSKRLLVAAGPVIDAKGKYPISDALAAAPNGAAASLVPAEDWKRAFAQADKLAGRHPEFPAAAVVPSEKVTTFAATSAAGKGMCQAVVNGEGRFPPFMDIIGGTTRADVVFSVRVCPKLLGELLLAINAMSEDPGNAGVTLEFHGKTGGGTNRPFLVKGERTDGVEVTGLMMPLAD